VAAGAPGGRRLHLLEVRGLGFDDPMAENVCKNLKKVEVHKQTIFRKIYGIFVV
jgi:hypothetical protein